MKILSYNVNGIRAALRKGFLEWLQAADPDVVCIQETKASPDQLDTSVFEALGYHHYWVSAEKKGYSGVAILSKTAPLQIVTRTGIDAIDQEGRFIRADFPELSVASLYLPSGTNPARLEFKFGFMDIFQAYVDQLKYEVPKLLICGDYNICHEAIDIHDPVRNKKVSGFLPEERQWLDQFLKRGFTDTFRHLNPDPHHYSWWSYRANARANNKGWRIDYALATDNLIPYLERAFLLPQAMHSDHCPVGVQFTFEPSKG